MVQGPLSGRTAMSRGGFGQGVTLGGLMGGTVGEATFSNPKFDSFPRQLPTDSIVQRGYMRLLTEVFELGVGGTPINRSNDMVGEALYHPIGAKLNFQFNPDSLNRSVTARTDTQLWINQSPTQLMQPGIGDMNWGWTMLFNREAEVTNNYLDRLKRTALDLEGRNISNLDVYSEGGMSGTTAAAAQLGVLADIAILDRITGQSISKQQIEYATARQQRLIDLRVIDPPEGPGEGNTIAEIAESLGLLDEDNPDNIMSANSQNAAFLVPNPIRAVFSQHFMVDGYVNTVTVSYQKFSPEMVPTVALVDISMHAIYQGFARRRTTFTTFLELAQHETISTNDSGEDSDNTEIATPDQGVVHLLQQAGMVRPVLTGIDHSPPTDGFWGDNIPRNPETHFTDHHTLVGEADSSASEIQLDAEDPAINSALVKVNNGFSFTPISYLDPDSSNTPLGRILSLAVQGLSGSGFNRQKLSGNIHLGLSVRARLKGSLDDMMWLTSTGPIYGSGGSAPSGGDNGFLEQASPHGFGARDGVFFGTWPSGQRKLLLGIGYDNLCGLNGQATGSGGRHLTGAEQDGLWQAFKNQSSTTDNVCLTRSFPITHHHSGHAPAAPIEAGAVGDLLDMKVTDFNANQIDITKDNYIFLTEVPKWEESEMMYYIANGFWDKGDTDASSDEANRYDDNYVAFPYLAFNGTNYITGPQEYDLDDADVDYPTPGDAGNAWRSVLLLGDRDFTVHYQMRVLMKVIVRYKVDNSNLIISNTGWMAVYPRTKNSELVAQGWGWKDIRPGENPVIDATIKIGRDRATILQGDLQGNVNTGIPHHNGVGGDPGHSGAMGYPWQTGGDDKLSDHGGDLRASQHFDGMMYSTGHRGGGMSQWDLGHSPTIITPQTSLYIGRTREPYLDPSKPFGLYRSQGSKFDKSGGGGTP